MKNIYRTIWAIMVCFCVGMLCGCSNAVDPLEKDRNLIIVNDTKQIINEIHVFVDEGIEVEEMFMKNPDKNSIQRKIPNNFKEYSDFHVVLIDRYNLKYAKDISGVAAEGKTKVVITEDDYIEEEGDFWKKIEQWFNGD